MGNPRFADRRPWLSRRYVRGLQWDSRKLWQAPRLNSDDGIDLPRALEKLKPDPEDWERWLVFVHLALPEIEKSGLSTARTTATTT